MSRARYSGFITNPSTFWVRPAAFVDRREALMPPRPHSPPHADDVSAGPLEEKRIDSRPISGLEE